MPIKMVRDLPDGDCVMDQVEKQEVKGKQEDKKARGLKQVGKKAVAKAGTGRSIHPALNY
jgi:hypothetical protein